jgi:hypothetical protein
VTQRKKEMGRECSMYWGTGEVDTGFWWGNLREGDNLEDLGVDWWIILKRICKKWDRETEWIALAQSRKRWLAFVNEVLNIRLP